MRLDQIERQPGNRKARRWSLWLAVAVHMLLLGVVLHLWSSGLRDITLSAAQPMLSGEVIDAQALPPVEVEATVQGNFAVEPSAELVDSMAQRMGERRDRCERKRARCNKRLLLLVLLFRQRRQISFRRRWLTIFR